MNNNIPEHWQMKKLKEVGEITSGGTPSTIVNEYWNGNISWISPADLSGYNEKIILKGRKSITESGLNNSSARLIPKGSVLFSSRAPIGYVVIAGNDVCTNQGFKSIIPNKSILSDFLYFFLKASKQKAEKVASGTTFKEISLKAFSLLEIPLPSIIEQKTIVSKIEELLSDLENGKQQLQTAQQQLKTYRQSLLKWAFEGRFGFAQRPSNTVIDGELPKGWKWVKIDFFLSDKKKGMATGPFGTMLRKSEHKKIGIPVLGIENIGEGVFQMPNKIFITNEKAIELKNFRVKENDIIISRSGTVGEICLLPKKMENSIISTNLIRVSLNQEIIYPKFFVYLFQGGKVRQQVFDLCSGSSRAFLNQTILNSLDFPFCPLEEQHRIVDTLASKLTICDKIEETITQSLQQAETLRQSILKKAFEGKLV